MIPVKRLPILWGLCAPLLASACGSSISPPTLEELRAATAKYGDIEVALAEGYIRDPLDVCETPYHMGLTTPPEVLGVMGIHYLRRDLLGIEENHTRLDVKNTHTDFLQPAVLLYEPQADGSLALLGVENLVSATAWAAEGHSLPPAFGSQNFAYTPDDPAQSISAHYDLHIWLHRENPSGTFFSYNPNASCEHHVFNMPVMMPPGMEH